MSLRIYMVRLPILICGKKWTSLTESTTGETAVAAQVSDKAGILGGGGGGLEMPPGFLLLKEERESDSDCGPEARPHQEHGVFPSKEALKDLPISWWGSWAWIHVLSDSFMVPHSLSDSLLDILKPLWTLHFSSCFQWLEFQEFPYLSKYVYRGKGSKT